MHPFVPAFVIRGDCMVLERVKAYIPCFVSQEIVAKELCLEPRDAGTFVISAQSTSFWRKHKLQSGIWLYSNALKSAVLMLCTKTLSSLAFVSRFRPAFFSNLFFQPILFSAQRLSSSMASSTKILVAPSVKTEFAVPNLHQDAADRASKILQENHDKHHITFSDVGFHSR